MSLNESHIEEVTLEWLAALGYALGHGPDMAPGESAAERGNFTEIVPEGHLLKALQIVHHRHTLLPNLLSGELLLKEVA